MTRKRYTYLSIIFWLCVRRETAHKAGRHASVARLNSLIASARHEIFAAPGFAARYGREPIAGIDYDPNGTFCQDDYEYLTGTGRYR